MLMVRLEEEEQQFLVQPWIAAARCWIYRDRRSQARCRMRSSGYIRSTWHKRGDHALRLQPDILEEVRLGQSREVVEPQQGLSPCVGASCETFLVLWLHARDRFVVRQLKKKVADVLW